MKLINMMRENGWITVSDNDIWRQVSGDLTFSAHMRKHAADATRLLAGNNVSPPHTPCVQDKNHQPRKRTAPRVPSKGQKEIYVQQPDPTGPSPSTRLAFLLPQENDPPVNGSVNDWWAWLMRNPTLADEVIQSNFNLKDRCDANLNAAAAQISRQKRIQGYNRR